MEHVLKMELMDIFVIVFLVGMVLIAIYVRDL
jgi:hypothetical protein